MRVLWRIVVKEFQQLRRDRKMIPALIVGPLVQLLALGFAANLDVRDIPFVLVDRDHSSSSRDLVDRFTGSGYFRLAGVETEIGGVDRWLAEGKAQVALVIGAGYGADLAAGRTADVQVLADGTDSISGVIGMGYAGRIVAAAGLDAVPDAPKGIVLVPRVWYNPDLLSRWFYVPAVLAFVLMLVTLILPSMAVVREKEIGTLEQLIVTPVRPWQLIVGKLVPFFAIGLVVTVLVTALTRLVFGVPLEGSVFTLLVFTALFLPTTLGLGVLTSTVVRTQQQAMMTATFVWMVPMIYLSGLIFPIENMPKVLQWATYGIPLRYFNNVLRGVFLKGSGFDVLWPEALALAGFGVVVVSLAALRFRKSLD